jgi:hypothetical protein
VNFRLGDEILGTAFTEPEKGGSQHGGLGHGDDEIVVKLAVLDGLGKPLMHLPSDLPALLQPGLEETDNVLDQILSIPQPHITGLVRTTPVVFLTEDLPTRVAACSLLQGISFRMQGRNMRGMESIDDLDSPILQHDLSHLADAPLLDGGEVVGDLEGPALLVG